MTLTLFNREEFKDMKRYKIQIFQLETVERETTNWVRLHDKTTFDTEKDPQYSYVKCKKAKEEEIKIYEQIKYTDFNLNFNLKKVIDAFNQI
jgi:hypothetical protein